MRRIFLFILCVCSCSRFLHVHVYVVMFWIGTNGQRSFLSNQHFTNMSSRRSNTSLELHDFLIEVVEFGIERVKMTLREIWTWVLRGKVKFDLACLSWYIMLMKLDYMWVIVGLR
jgi:hypothetical protein